MREYVGHVVRRGLETAKEGFKDGNGKHIDIKVPGWMYTVLMFTVIAFSIVMLSVCVSCPFSCTLPNSGPA